MANATRSPHQQYSFVQLDRDAHSSAPMWYQKEWTEFGKAEAGTTNPSDGDSQAEINARRDFGYLTDENGEFIGAEGVKDLRNVSWTTWRLADGDFNPYDLRQIPPPRTWVRGGNSHYRDRYRDALEREFPWLRLCDKGWKLHAFATAVFPNFRQWNPAPTRVVGSSPDDAIEVADSDEGTGNPSESDGGGSASRPAKRKRVQKSLGRAKTQSAKVHQISHPTVPTQPNAGDGLQVRAENILPVSPLYVSFPLRNAWLTR